MRFEHSAIVDAPPEVVFALTEAGVVVEPEILTEPEPDAHALGMFSGRLADQGASRGTTEGRTTAAAIPRSIPAKISRWIG